MCRQTLAVSLKVCRPGLDSTPRGDPEPRTPREEEQGPPNPTDVPAECHLDFLRQNTHDIDVTVPITLIQ